MRRMFSIKQLRELAGVVVDEKVPAMIQADKDVISKITMEYNEDEEITLIYFPKNIGLLAITINTHTLYLLNDKLVDNTGNEVEGYQVDGIYVIEDAVEIDIVGDITEQVINNLSYYLFNGEIELISDTYHIFFPVTSGGTTLYKHEVTFNGGNYCKISFISTDNTPVANIGLINAKALNRIVDASYGSSFPQVQINGASYGSGSLVNILTQGTATILKATAVSGNSITIVNVDLTDGSKTETSYSLGDLVSDTVTEL